MAIDTFTREDFETYLNSNHSPFEYVGLDKGEHTYSLTLDSQVSIAIRSSIRDDSLSADVGKDSIRVWLQCNGKPISSKTARTHRTKGWQNRLSEKIDQLTLWRTLAGDCKECDRPKGIFKAKTEKNEGRPFAKCREHNSFVWLDKPIKRSDIYFKGENNNNDTSETADQEDSMAHNEKQDNDNMQSGSTSEICSNAAEIPRSVSSVPKLSKEPNEAQRKAIEADVNTNLRVLAPPGSGKTFLIEHRYKYLVDNGINPQNILVCTFSKAMADEMGKRIQQTCQEAILEQISTIHAFCYRLLTRWDETSRWYKWQVPKDWQVKKTLEDAIGTIWEEKEKPNASEVLGYINTSKYLGLTTDDSYQWFIDVLGQQYGEWLYEIRSKFDAWLNRSRFLTFTDMLYLVEKKLEADETWRTGLQEKFSHVIVDEAQDTNYQAMRILVTISLEPGINTVYGDR